jgi:hypothetical protein
MDNADNLIFPAQFSILKISDNDKNNISFLVMVDIGRGV